MLLYIILTLGRHYMRYFWLFAFVGVFHCVAASATVVSSIKPIDLLVKDLTGGAVDSIVLLNGSASPHHYAMRPSDLLLLRDADLVIWIGPELEGFLAKPLKKRKRKTLTIGHVFNVPDRRHVGHEHHSAHDFEHNGTDAHYWLSYKNAGLIARELALVLAGSYPELKEAIDKNLRDLLSSFESERRVTAEAFEGFGAQGFGVYHDGYHAYVDEFGLNQLAFVKLMPDQPISLKKMADLKRTLVGASCLLIEQAEFKPAAKIAKKLDVKPVAIDLLGLGLSSVSAESFLFTEYMKGVRRAFTDCLLNTD